MKIRIELEIDLGDNFIDPNDKEDRDWLFNYILTEDNLFLQDYEIGDTIGDVKKVIKCEEVGRSEQFKCRNVACNEMVSVDSDDVFCEKHKRKLGI